MKSGISSHTQTTQDYPKLVKPAKIITHLLCTCKRPISYNDIAVASTCTRTYAKRKTKELINEGVINKDSTTHLHARTKKDGTTCGRMAGKNKYARGENFDAKKHLIPGVEIRTDEVVGTHKWWSPWATRIGKAREYKTYRVEIRRQKTAYDKIEEYYEACRAEYEKSYPLDRNRVNNNYNIAKDKKVNTNLCGKLESLLKNLGLTDVVKLDSCPSWWLNNLSILSKSLKLLKAKLSKGFKPHNIYKFITHLMKKEGCGYRSYQAKQVKAEITAFKRKKEKQTNSDAPASATPTIDDLETELKNLKKAFSAASVTGQDPEEIHQQIAQLKRKLVVAHAQGDLKNCSFGSFDPCAAAFLEDTAHLKLEERDIYALLRKGGKRKLQQALEVTVARVKLKSRPLDNVLGFLHYLFTLKTPYDYLERKEQAA